MAHSKGAPSASGMLESFAQNPYQAIASLALIAYFLLTQNFFFAALIAIVTLVFWVSETYGAGERKFPPINDALGKKLEKINNSKALYGVLFLALLVFILTKQLGLVGMLFGMLGGAALVALVVVEILLGLWKGGIRNEVNESVSAILLALVVWFGLCLALNVPSPINAIVSCSMVPHLERGDMVLLAGGEPDAPVLQMGISEIAQITNRGIVRYQDETFEVNGSLFFHCLNYKDERCAVFFKEPGAFIEQHGPIAFKYSLCKRVNRNDDRSVLYPCVASFEYKGQVIQENISNDVVVYQSPAGDLFAMQGDTIHRVFAKIMDENGEEYLLMKGDNNHYFDLQAYVAKDAAGRNINRGNSLVKREQLKGKVIVSVPYLGYFKLFLSGLMQPAILVMDEGCDSVFEKFKR